MKRRKFNIGDRVIAYFAHIGGIKGTVDFIHLNGTLFVKADDRKSYGKFAHPMQVYPLEQEDEDEEPYQWTTAPHFFP